MTQKAVRDMDVRRELEERTLEAEGIIRRFLPREEGYQKTIMEAMSYALMSPGKRLRPILMRECAACFDQTSPQALPFFMAAIEMIHAYSLVHDDLPAMDNYLLRRGKPTTHARFGEAMGVLAGDALLNYAFETALQSLETDGTNPAVHKSLILLARKAGIYGMIGGQVVDVESEHIQGMDKHRLDFIHELKTGALIEAAMCIGALLGGADESQLLTVEQAAAKIGLAFQIEDDILDITGDEKTIGKPVGSDERNHKVTYVTFAGLEGARRDAESLTREALENLASLPRKNDFLMELVAYLARRNR